MQIELYLPLPTLDGLIGFALIWYILGVIVFSFCLLKKVSRHKGVKSDRFPFTGLILLPVAAIIFPFTSRGVLKS